VILAERESIERMAKHHFTTKISHSQFHAMVSGMIGMEITRARPGSGSCLLIEVGKTKIETFKGRSGKLHQFPRGHFGLMIEFDWRVERERSIEFGSASGLRRMDRGIESLRGERISGVALIGDIPELKISLSSRRRLASFMTIESQPAWVVFLNFHESWIHVRRGCLYHSNET
jgi:hypothetical protein